MTADCDWNNLLTREQHARLCSHERNSAARVTRLGLDAPDRKHSTNDDSPVSRSDNRDLSPSPYEIPRSLGYRHRSTPIIRNVQRMARAVHDEHTPASLRSRNPSRNPTFILVVQQCRSDVLQWRAKSIDTKRTPLQRSLGRPRRWEQQHHANRQPSPFPVYSGTGVVPSPVPTALRGRASRGPGTYSSRDFVTPSRHGTRTTSSAEGTLN